MGLWRASGALMGFVVCVEGKWVQTPGDSCRLLRSAGALAMLWAHKTKTSYARVSDQDPQTLTKTSSVSND